MDYIARKDLTHDAFSMGTATVKQEEEADEK